MGVSIYPVLDKDVPGFDVTYVIGKMLAKALPCGEDSDSPLLPLTNFIWIAPETLTWLMEEAGDNPEESDLPREQWFDAGEGLAAVRAALQNLPADFDARVFDDLRDIENALSLAQEHGARFHFAFDF